MAKIENMAASMANAPFNTPPATKSDLKFPEVSFRLVGNARSYEDRIDKSKSTSRIAYVDFVTGRLFQTAGSIYLETTIKQTSDGRHEVKALRFSLPKGLELRADLPAEVSGQVDAWKDAVVDQYIAWRKSSGAIVAGPKQTAGYRTIE